MVEGRVHTHGTLSAVRQRSERSARSQRQLPSTASRASTLSCLGVDR